MSPATLSAKKHSRILVAGADPAQRAAVLHDLSESLPAGAQLGEAGAVAEVLERAPSSSVVMLAGDLGEVSAESLMHMLGSRHPSLPVVALGLPIDRSSTEAGRHSPSAEAGDTRCARIPESASNTGREAILGW